MCVGSHISQLKGFAEQLEAFTTSHSLQDTSDGVLLREQLLSWHRQFLQLQDAIHRDFDVVWAHSNTSSNLILALYIVSQPLWPTCWSGHHVHHTVIGRCVHSTVLSTGQHVLQEQTYSRKDQSVDIFAVCDYYMDSVNGVPAPHSTTTGNSH